MISAVPIAAGKLRTMTYSVVSLGKIRLLPLVLNEAPYRSSIHSMPVGSKIKSKPPNWNMMLFI
jgi:hypothetical protein